MHEVMGAALLIRADAGPAIGSGHAMRMLALAEAWREKAGPVAWLGTLPPAVAERAEALGVQRVEGETRAVADQLNAAWIAADGYGFGESWQRAVVGGKARLLIVDDNAENRPYVADCVLNLNVHAEAGLYRDRAPHTRLLLGSKYALLRSEFRRAGAESRTVPPKASRWLVTMGGADPVDATGRFLTALAGSSTAGVEVEVLVGGSNPRLPSYQALAARSSTPIVFSSSPPDVTVPMKRAELAFSASGGTVWELALLGVPAAVISLADNQVKLAEALAALGVVESLGDASGDAQAWLAALVRLAADPKRRAGYVQRAREQVDGQGAYRVVAALQEGKTDAEL